MNIYKYISVVTGRIRIRKYYQIFFYVRNPAEYSAKYPGTAPTLAQISGQISVFGLAPKWDICWPYLNSPFDIRIRLKF